VNAQPALLAHSAAVWAVVRDAIGAGVRAAAGHSLGEFSAYHVSGAFELADAARVVRRRQFLFNESSKIEPFSIELRTVRSPFMARASSRLIARPSPVPSWPVVSVRPT